MRTLVTPEILEENEDLSKGAALATAVAVQFSAKLAADDPELTALIQAWPMLPAAMRTGILAMIEAAKQGA